MDITSNVSTTLVLSFYTSTNKYPNKNKNNGQTIYYSVVDGGSSRLSLCVVLFFFVQIQNGSLFF